MARNQLNIPGYANGQNCRRQSDSMNEIGISMNEIEAWSEGPQAGNLKITYRAAFCPQTRCGRGFRKIFIRLGDSLTRLNSVAPKLIVERWANTSQS